MNAFNWSEPVSYTTTRKASFHSTARSRLGKLAHSLGLLPGTYDIRSNKAGIAVSGEVTLHADDIYVQVSQPCFGHDSGILVRQCNGRKDYTGGKNHFFPLAMLNDVHVLTCAVRRIRAYRPEVVS